MTLLVNWAQAKDVKSQQFALYTFEKMTECHLTPEQLTTHKESFFAIFESLMKEGEAVETRVAAFKATVCYLQSVTDEKITADFKKLLPGMFAIVVDSLKSNEEDLGKQVLEKLVDLTQMSPSFLKDHLAAITKIVSDIVRTKEFETGTRTQACEVVLNLTEHMPAMMRKVPEMKADFFQAVVQLVTECEQDADTWKEMLEDEQGTGSDAYSTGVNAISRLSV